MPGSITPTNLRSRLVWLALIPVLLAIIAVAAYVPGRLLWAEQQYQAARKAFAERNFDQAAEYLGTYLDVQPNSVEAHFLLAQTSRRAGFYDEAEVQYDICDWLQGPSDAVELERTLLRVQQGDLSAETFLLGRIQADEAGTDLVVEALTRGYQKNYLIRKMRDCLDGWLQHHSGDTYALLQSGWVAERHHDHHRAVAEYTRALDANPEHVESRLRRGQAWLLLKKPSAALTDLETLHSRLPRNSEISLALAECLAKLGRTQEAATLLNDLAEHHTSDAKILLERGRLALQEGKPGQAEPDLRQALARAPRDHGTLYSYSLCLKRLGKEKEWAKVAATLKEVEADLERMDKLTTALQARPNDPDLRCEIGKIFLRAREDKEGVLWLKGALRVDPAHRATHETLADYFARNNQPAEAARHRRQAATATSHKRS